MRMVNRVTRAAAVAVATAALVFALPSASEAVATTGSTAQEITHSVFTSADPHAAFNALAPAKRAVFLDAFRHQTSKTVVNKGGRYHPNRSERAKMQQAGAPAQLRTTAKAAKASGCWYHYWEKSWSDLGIHDGTTWMQLNWCGSGGRITSWSQSNVGCAGYHGASCSVSSKAERNVGWEVRSSRYYNATFFGFSNTVCMQIRGGATGLYSTRSSNSGTCSLN